MPPEHLKRKYSLKRGKVANYSLICTYFQKIIIVREKILKLSDS